MRVNWSTVGERYYETGVDRGVLYVDGQDGVPWNGLISVSEAPSMGDSRSYYLDGFNYLNLSGNEQFAAAISAYYSPPEFDACDGIAALSTGLFVTQQPRKTFGLSYRTTIGNDLEGPDYAHKIHLIYNALAEPTTKAYNSIGQKVDPNALQWNIRSRPILIDNHAPSAHIVINTAETLPETIALLEDIIYGTDSEPPRLPTPDELVSLFSVGSLIYTETRLTNPDRTVLTGTWGSAVFTDDARSVLVQRPTWNRTYQQRDVPLIDDFNRTRVGTAWGIATAGGKWQHVGGTEPNNYSVAPGSPGEGKLTIDTTNISRHSYLGSYDLEDQIVSATFRLGRRPTEAGGLGFGVTLNRVDTSNHYRCKLEVENPNLTDDFTRTVTGGFGTLTSGEAWSTNGGTSADYSVDGSVGKIIMSAKNSSRRVYASAATDSEILVKVTVPALATGGSYSAAAVSRYKDASNHYMARLAFATTGQVTLRLQAQNAGATVDLTAETAITNGTYTAGSSFWLRFKTSGGTLSARAWKDGDAEPTTYLSVTDGSVTGSGAVGLRAYAFSSNTNVATTAISFDNFSVIREDGKDILTATIQKDVAGTLTDLISTTVGAMDVGTSWRIEGRRFDTGIEMRAWQIGSARPVTPTLITTDSTYTQGRGGVYAFTKTNEPSIDVYVSDYAADGTVVTPAQFTTDGRVYALLTPFSGTIDKFSLLDMLSGGKEDLIDIAMQFITGAPDSYNDAGEHVRGDAHYGARDVDGSLIEGSDFNDYMGVPWTYGSTIDNPEPEQIGALDCSGYVRMCFGPEGLGMPVIVGSNDGDGIPRTSYSQMAADGPGASVIANVGTTPTDRSPLQLGDVVGFDADSNDEDISGQIDHVGIYLGLDSLGEPLFVSSRKSIDGPTFSKSGGSSNLTGTGLYATRFRVARRF